MKKFLMALYKPLFKLIASLSTKFWCWWSNRHFKDAIRVDTTLLLEEDKLTLMKEIRQAISRLFSKFKYTKDGPEQLWDAVTPPPQNYKHYLDGELKDDCDGFHSLVHYVLSMNNIKAYLLSVKAFGAGHCVLLFTFKNKWYVNDYYSIYGPYATPAEAVADYNEKFAKIYKTKSEVLFNAIVNYDYIKGLFYIDKSLDLKKKEEEEPKKVAEDTATL